HTRFARDWSSDVCSSDLRLTPNEFVAVTSTNIAKILNMNPKKGAILEGADADIIVWDPERKKTISAGNQQSVIDYNVFDGIEVTIGRASCRERRRLKARE